MIVGGPYLFIHHLYTWPKKCSIPLYFEKHDADVNLNYLIGIETFSHAFISLIYLDDAAFLIGGLSLTDEGIQGVASSYLFLCINSTFEYYKSTFEWWYSQVGN